MTNSSSTNSGSAILEDDQQLYDWGIENRLDQYYQVRLGPHCLLYLRNVVM